MSTQTTTRVTCHCGICAANAAKLGRTELAAEITEEGVARLAGRNGRLTRTAIHGVVHAANHPQLGAALVKHHSAYWSA